jgi:hypothetical protein
MRRDRARYGVDGGYGGIPIFFLAGAGLLAGDRWAKRRDKRLLGSLAKIGAVAGVPCSSRRPAGCLRAAPPELMTLKPVPDHVLRQIVDDIFIPLVTS